jgi:hypothetical protein
LFLNSLMRSVPRNTSNTKGSPTLQSSISYLNENSTESGFGSDIFDIGATDFGRNSSTIERVNLYFTRFYYVYVVFYLRHSLNELQI